MKIAFIGDSFCADIDVGTWPILVKEYLNAEIVWKGKQGCSEYTILKHLKKIIETIDRPKIDMAIICHTDPYRLANRHHKPLGAGPCEMNKNVSKIWNAGNLYYEHLMEYGFHELSHIALVKECDKICKETNTKVLHLFSFSTKELNFRDYNWDVRLENSYNKKSLARISYDYQTPDNDEQKWAPGDLGWVTLPNHMNYAGNKVVSEIVLGML
tara:strand:- start:100 stop:738 length:639 start_codon:yes stop_codon:yes gene_type:complete